MPGTGFFTKIGSGDGGRADASTYQLSPKYNDPFVASNDERRMSKFIMSSELVRLYKEIAGSSTDTVLNLLSQGTRGYFEFFLQSADEDYSDKYQIVETLGDSYAAFGLGRRPLIFNYGGVLLNSTENDWRINFINFFSKYGSISRLARLKPTKLKKAHNTITLVYDSVHIRGALLNLKTTIRAENELVVPFAFSMLVTGSDTFNLLELDRQRAAEVVTPSSPVTTHVSTEDGSSLGDEITTKTQSRVGDGTVDLDSNQSGG